jgi:hypothetical protein
MAITNETFNAWQGMGAAAGGLLYASEITDRGQGYANEMGKLAANLQDQSGFKGYGVKTGVGQSNFAADGSLDVGVGPDQGMINAANQGALGGMDMMQQAGANMGANQGAYMNASQQAMNNSMQNMAGREQDIYGRAMAMQQPLLDQQRAQMNAREYAQGRSGIRGSQFGGSGEDAAMARAQAQAQNNASFQAMGQAQQEMMNQANMASQYGQMGQGMNSAMGQMGQGMGQMGQGMYNMGYMAPNYQLNALQAGAQGGNMAQTGQLTGTGYGAQLGLGGIQTSVNADKAASEMYGNIVASMMNNANGENGSSSWLGSLLPF